MRMQAPPPAPDPMQTAKAQSQMNRETAITQYGLNATNQRTPYGDVTYKQVGTWEDGTPRFEATQSLSPEQQEIFNRHTQMQRNLGDIGVSQTSRINDLLSRPVNLNNEATEARLMELGRKRLDPMFSERDRQMETDLANRGISMGSEAYRAARGSFNEGRNDAYNQLLLQGRGQAIQEALTERNQPLNEINALMSGTQVQQPNFINTPTPGVAPVDYMGAVSNKMNYDLSRTNMQNQSNNAFMQGLFGLGGTLGGNFLRANPMTMWSDRRLKTDVEKVGKLDDGTKIYKFRYREGTGLPGLMQLGVMAQDIEKKHPDVVHTDPRSGYKAVDVAALAEAA